MFISSGDLLADRRHAHARGYAEDGDHAAAADLFEQTLERVPGWLPARVGLADALIALDRRMEAAVLLEAIAADDPDGLFGAALKLAALGRAPVPETPPEAYVRGLFDGYADRFERALVEGLGYRVPWAMGERIAGLRPPREEGPVFGRVLDLGCGTGLMGEVLRGRAGHLVGVDLSAEMVDKAAAKSVYDRLAVADVAAFLKEAEAGWDLVTAADVFVYVGTLDAVFEAVAARLAPGGLFAFSVEREESGDVVLRDSLRYAHGEDHLRRLAAANGLTVVLAEREILRMDRGAPVDGLLMVLERPVAEAVLAAHPADEEQEPRPAAN